MRKLPPEPKRKPKKSEIVAPTSLSMIFLLDGATKKEMESFVNSVKDAAMEKKEFGVVGNIKILYRKSEWSVVE